MLAASRKRAALMLIRSPGCKRSLAATVYASDKAGVQQQHTEEEEEEDETEHSDEKESEAEHAVDAEHKPSGKARARSKEERVVDAPPRRPVRRLIVGLGNPGDRFAQTRHNVGFIAVRHFVDRTLPRLLWRHTLAASSIASPWGLAGVPAAAGTPIPKTSASPALTAIGSGGEALHCSTTLAFSQAQPMDQCIVDSPAHGDDLVDLTSIRRKARTTKESVHFPEVQCLLPQTFMNRSGGPLRKFLDRGHWRLKRNPQSAARGDDLIILYDDVSLPFGTIAVRHKGGPGTHNGIIDVLRRLGGERVARIKIGVGNPHTPSPTGHKAMDQYVLGKFAPHEADKLPALSAMIAEVLRVYLHRGVDAAATAANGLHVDEWIKQSKWAEWGGKPPK